MEAASQQLTADWEPLAMDAPVEAIFPSRIGDWQQTIANDQAAIARLCIDLPGRHAAYASGARELVVCLDQINDAAREVTFQRMQSLNDAQAAVQGSRMIVKLAHWCYFAASGFGSNQL